MRRSTRWTAAAALAGVFTLVGFSPALSQQPAPAIDIDAMVAELGLSEEQAAELIRLDELLASQIQIQEQAFGVQEALAEVYATLLSGLTGEQLRGLQASLHQQGPGDRWAFEELAGRYLPSVHAVVASYLAEPADVEDAAQEAFLRALDQIRSFDVSRPFAPWLYQVARNVARNRRKALSRQRLEPLPTSGVTDREPDPAETLERRELRTLVAGAVDRLPEQRRTVFRLFDVEGRSAREIAGLMAITEGTVRSHVHHARRALRRELAPLLER